MSFFAFQSLPHVENLEISMKQTISTLDEASQKYLQGKHVSAPVAAYRTVANCLRDFAAVNLPNDNNKHLRAKYYASLEVAIARNYPLCQFGDPAMSTRRVVSSPAPNKPNKFMSQRLLIKYDLAIVYCN
jgi:hypothetical protein